MVFGLDNEVYLGLKFCIIYKFLRILQNKGYIDITCVRRGNWAKRKYGLEIYIGPAQKAHLFKDGVHLIIFNVDF